MQGVEILEAEAVGERAYVGGQRGFDRGFDRVGCVVEQGGQVVVVAAGAGCRVEEVLADLGCIELGE